MCIRGGEDDGDKVPSATVAARCSFLQGSELVSHLPKKGWGWKGAEGRGRRPEPVASDWLTFSRSVSGLGGLQREML